SNCSDCEFLVILGDFDFTRDDEPSSVQRLSAVEVHEHPHFVYAPGSSYHDLAIIVLDRTPQISRYVKPLCLPPPSARSDTFAGQNATTTGWGITSISGNSALSVFKSTRNKRHEA
ncbi:hypothetical protein L9F63_018645, partial [Diploptera punctata]